MKIRTKILLLFTLGAGVPLLLSHFFAQRMLEASLEERIAASLRREAAQTAGRIDDRIERSIEEIGLVVEAVPFESFAPADLHRALELPYREIPAATIVALLDEEGRALAEPFRLDPAAAADSDREGAGKPDLDRFSKGVPLKLAITAGVAVGPVYRSAAGRPRMVIAKSFSVGGGAAMWVLAVETSLASVCALTGAAAAVEHTVRLLDLAGRDVCKAAQGEAGSVPPAAGKVSAYAGADGRRLLGTVEEVATTGWRLVAEQPEDVARAPVRRSMTWSLLWLGVSLLIAVAGGAVLARSLSEPIRALERAASRIADGNYDQTLQVASRDELGGLARAFDRMTAEIRAWNMELTSRVEERTRALREAKEQILQSQKLAAVGELGAGVAHEINNPLTAVIGTAQILRMQREGDAEVSEALDDIIRGARRVAEVVEVLLRFSQSQVDPEMQVADAGRMVESVLRTFSVRLAERRIASEASIADGCFVHAKEGDLRLVLNHVMDNALRYMPEGGRLATAVDRVEGGAVSIAVADTGPGMPEEVRARAFDPFFTTSPPGSGNKGLGLALVHRVVSEHDGRVVLESEPGKGTTVRIYLPAATRLSRV